MAISKKTWTASAKEATPGTAITTPTIYIPTVTAFHGTKKFVYLNEERGDRNANYGVVDSIRATAIDMKGPFYPDASAIAFWAALGMPTSAQQGGSSAYKHTFNLNDIPATYTLFRHLDAKSYYVPYGALEKFQLTFNTDGKLLDLNSTWCGLYAVINATPPTPTYSTVLPMAGYAPTIKFIDGIASTDIVELTLDYAQKVELWYPANGQPDFVTIYFGERTIDFSFTARFDNDTLYQKYRTSPQAQDSLTFDVQGALITSTYYYELQFVLPNIHYDDMEHDTSKTNVLIKAKGKATVPSGSSLITGFIQNATTSYTT